MTARDEQHSADPLRSIKYQLLSRVLIIPVTGHVYNIVEHTDGESSAGNARA